MALYYAFTAEKHRRKHNSLWILFDSLWNMAHISSMAIDSILLQRGVRDGKYDELLDVSEFLGEGDYGSAPNALAVMVRQSPLFQSTLAELRKAALQEVPA